MTDMISTAAWFAERCGVAYRPDAETLEEARMRTGLELANAEAWAARSDIEFVWEDDWMVGSHVHEFGSEIYSAEPDTCETCRAVAPDGETLASLGCIDDADTDYRRLVEAELALEAMPS